MLITSNCIYANNHLNNSDGRGILIGKDCESVHISDNIIGTSSVASGINYQLSGIELVLGCKKITVCNNDVRNNVSSITLPVNMEVNNIVCYDNVGYNENLPGIIPALPTSDVDFKNPYGTECMVYIYDGTLTKISLNGTIFSTSTGVTLTIGKSDILKITYTVAPSWVWWRR